MRILRIAVFWLFALATLAPQSALARSETRSPLPDQIVAGGTFTLRTGDVLDGNLLVLGGVVELEEGSRISGDVLVVGGTVSMHGEVEGNLVALGGVVALEETVIIRGDMFAPGSVVSRHEGATVEGQVVTQAPNLTITVPEPPQTPSASPELPYDYFQNLQYALSPLTEGIWFLFQAVVVACLAVLAVVFFPAHTVRARQSIAGQPMVSIGLGLLVFFLLIPISLVLTLTLFLIPVVLLLIFAVAVATLFGWAVLGFEVGRRLAEAFQQRWSPAAQIGIGTFVTTFLLGGVQLMFWDIFWLILAVGLGALGLGSVVLTRFGTREYQAPPAIATSP